MSWETPTLRQVREMVRDDITSALTGAVMIGNSVLRVMADANAGLAHLTLRYIDWLARQFLPDTAETEWLDRHGDIWLVNADNSVGRKSATLASGSVTVTGVNGTILPEGTELTGQGIDADGNYATVTYETTEQITIGTGATPVNIIAVDSGVAGNIETGQELSLVAALSGVDGSAVVVELSGGTEEENDDDLRVRVLLRIQRPPMGGDSDDYVQWALAVPGVTRAWESNEMGMGCITVRVMMDELRDYQGGLPTQSDLDAVYDYLQTKRPVAIKDFFVEAPIPELINFTISNLATDNAATRAAIEASVKEMLARKAAPAHMINGVRQDAQTIYAAWVAEAVGAAAGVDYFNLTMTDAVMPYNGSMATFGTITYI